MKKWTALLSLASIVSLTWTASASAANASLIRAYEPDSLIKTDGSYWIWGGSQSVPTQVQGITEAKASFPYHFIVQEDNSVWHWSRETPSSEAVLTQADELKGLLSLQSLGKKLIALDTTGSVYTIPMADYEHPELGQITRNEALASVIDLTTFDVQYPLNNGGSQLVYLKKDGTVWSNSGAQPTIGAVKGLDHVIDVDRNMALKSDGTVWTWDGQSGHAAAQLKGLASITSFKQSHYSRLAIDEESRLWFWGATITGFSDGTTLNEQTPTRLTSINDVKDAVVAERFMLVLTNSGKVYETSIERDKMPANPTFKLLASDVSSFKEGWRHVIMQKTDGSLFGYGINKAAELGYGDYEFEHLSPVPVQEPISITLNGEPVYLSSGVMTRNNQSFVPLRSVFEKLGAKIAFNNETKIATVERATANGTKISISIDTLRGDTTLNGQAVNLATKPFSVNGTSYLPLRFISEQLGAKVEWSQQQLKIIITMP
ncbi:alpha-tubulin suppressor-like RCC1 family protein [Paenibacillus phyllosphaerae]|uniref:Alpha-tubulin suppressor-like RCC1 family protein n=1 Tax=Paenibacillus phyllosphaerae TaxID=274593 RepID=A0A7W5FRJ5_9BACL|nr:stalk domain-containing protein [Paenibacillus phyllosphaerae]MBB3114595.1 alpha-tubulin suppressor-like RCC1 family protein [Paenibacillus phyllosphaerae]